LRERLTEREIDAYRHPLVRFVGLDAYEQAGGGIRRDLFAEGDAGVYLTDAALLERLAQDKLAGIAAEVKAEGWAWVDATPGVTHADLHAFQRAPRSAASRTSAKRSASKLQAKMQELAEAVDAAMDADDEDKADLQEEGEALGEQLQALEDGLQDYAANVKAAAGAIVTIDRNGEAVIHRGLLREAEAKALRTLERCAKVSARKPRTTTKARRRAAQGRSHVRPAGAAVERPPHRRAANRSGPASASGAGRAGAWHGADRLAGSPLRPRPAAGREPESARPAGRHGPGLAESPAAVALRELQQAWAKPCRRTAPNCSPRCWRWGKPNWWLLAVCVASTVDVVTPRATPHQPGAELAQAVGWTWPHGGSRPPKATSSMFPRP
jgi:ParB family chromosome partitioning protein